MSKESAMNLMTGGESQVTPPQVVEASVQALEGQTPEGQTQTPAASELKSTPFNRLAQKEAELVKQRALFKQEQEAIAKEKQTLLEVKKKYDEYETAKKNDPVAALKMLGFSETDIINYLANSQPEELTPEQKAMQAAEKAAEARIKAFEDAQAKKIKEAQDAQDTQMIQGFKSEISKSITADKDKYEYCSYYGAEAEELAYQITLETLKASNGEEVLTAEEAVQLAEDYFESKDKELAMLKKRQPKAEVHTPPPSQTPERTRTVTPAAPNPDTPKPTITRSRTLSQGATSTIASSRLRMNETREQKRERLIEALRNGSKL